MCRSNKLWHLPLQSMTKAMSSNPHPKKPPEPPKKPGGGGPPKGPKTPIAEKGAPTYAAWKMTPPKPGESKEMQKGLQTYHWCTNHGTVGMWVAHKLAKCKGSCPEGEKSAKASEMKTDDKKTVRFNLQPSATIKTALATFNKAISWAELCSSDEELDF